MRESTVGAGFPARKPAPTARRRVTGAALIICGLVALASVGGWAVWSGSRTVTPNAAPLPARPFAVPANKLPALPAAELPAGGAVALPSPADSAPGSATRSTRPRDPSAGYIVNGYTGANRLFIRTLGVNAPVVPEAIHGTDLTIPGDVHVVGRSLAGAPVDATAGTTMLAGHVNYIGQGPGALVNLYRISPGAVVIVTDATARMTVWRVVSLQSIPKTQGLPRALFDRTGLRQLVVVTCGGPLLRVKGPHGEYNTYKDNIVVTAVSVGGS